MKFTRRDALASGLFASAASCARSTPVASFAARTDPIGGLFAHGVASGDPAHNSVVLWTRVTVDTPLATIEVEWETSNDERFAQINARGKFETGPARDWTVKILLEDLQPDETVFYRFRVNNVTSIIGRARTLPEGAVETARFAAISCSNFPFGYFNVYDLIARQDDLNAVIHLGDYIYEYSTDGYGGDTGTQLGRNHSPTHEINTLDDYRTRHGQYKSDPSAQMMHAMHPMIAIWDDHETANDSWRDGAENHDNTEGTWNARRRAALQAYYEWMPIRDPLPGKLSESLFRSYSFGDLLTITAIETRLMARAKQFQYSEILPKLNSKTDVDEFLNTTLWDTSREILGTEQLAFIKNAFQKSVADKQPWRVVANQITMARVTAPDLNPHVTEEEIEELQADWDQGRAFVETSALGLPSNFDAWDGYPAAREKFYDTVRDTGSDGMIVITGDTHTWWANDLIARNGDHMGVELGTHSVTSPSPYAKSFLNGRGAEYALLTNQLNSDVRYLNGENHGFIDLTITKKRARALFVGVDTIESPRYSASTKVAFDIKKTKRGVTFSNADGLTLKENFLF